MMTSLRLATLAISLAAFALPAAATTTFKTILSGANETTPNASPATGTGFLILADDQNSFRVLLDWSGLTAPATAGHVHCCAAPGANAPVAIGFSPVASTSGSIDATYDLTLLSTYSGGFLTGKTAAEKQAAFLDGLFHGLAYYNLHNANFPGGEIRGQLAAVPEPATWALMIGGFGLVGGALRQRRGTVVTA